MVSVPVHAPSVDEVGPGAGDDLASSHVHGNAHHAVRWDPAGRRHHRGHLGAPCL